MLSTLNQRANSHNSCEDSIFVREDDNYVYGIIADGCSSGKNSAFASQAVCYILERLDYPLMCNNGVIHLLRHDMQKLRDLLGLTFINLLSTMILFVYNKNTKELQIRVFGDGWYSVDGVPFIVDQNNIPDYIGYHINDDVQTFNKYLNDYPTRIYANVNKFMICSDGIERIERGQFNGEPTKDPKILHLEPTSPTYLTRMWNILKKDHYQLGDDLSIISYVKDN